MSGRFSQRLLPTSVLRIFCGREGSVKARLLGTVSDPASSVRSHYAPSCRLAQNTDEIFARDRLTSSLVAAFIPASVTWKGYVTRPSMRFDASP